MRKLFFLLFIICSTPIFSQEFSGINQSNYSGALGVDFNPANIADNRMKVDLFVGASFTGHNNYIYMNTSNMPGGWFHHSQELNLLILLGEINLGLKNYRLGFQQTIT